ncbi:MAG: alpha/beta hydrolase [Flavobacteriaceae bacterium]|nr:alpha/beta hydrolase [Flavobacteriaceae bacterium]
MRKIILSVLLFLNHQSYSQKIIDTIISQKLKEDREFSVSLPDSYSKNKTNKYPVLFLLDGDYLLDPFQGAINYGAYWDDFPEVIIVAISQNKKDERYSDCTFNTETGLPEGKGKNFFEFIGQELLPFIEKSYRIAPFRIIAGHDVTAGFLNFYLYKDKPIFNAYISLSPELPTQMEEIIPQRLLVLNQPIFYYHAIAGGDIKLNKERVIQLDSVLATIKKPNLNYLFDNFKGASHYSLVLQAIPNALYHIFGIYQPITVTEYNEKIAILPSGQVDYLNKKYETIEKLLALKTRIRFNDFKAIESAIIKNKVYDEFRELSNLAEKQYPKSMLANYELALMYEYTGEFLKARKYYQAAYEREEIGNLTQNMMYDKMEEMKNAKTPAQTETAPITPIPDQKP